MKNKTPKILAIISVILLIIGAILFIETKSLVSEENVVTAIFSILGVLFLRVIILCGTTGTIALMWLIYGLVHFIKKLKTDANKTKDIIAIILLSLPIVAGLITIIISLITSN